MQEDAETLYNLLINNIKIKGFMAIIKITKSRRVRWMWNVAHMRQKTNAYIVLVDKPEDSDQLADLSCTSF